MKSETPKLLNLDTSPKTLAVSLCDEVEPSLFLGSFDAVTKPELLNSLGISHILTVGPGMEIKDFPSHIKRKQILVLDEDNQNLLQYFDETNNFILEGLATNGKVLVHCMAGISRSATVVCAFLMKHRSLSSQEALSTLTTVRSIIDPNPGFREQLEIYEQIAFEVNVKHEPYRRFLISKMAEDFLCKFLLGFFLSKFLKVHYFSLFIALGHSNDMILGVDPEQMMTGGVPTPSSFLKIRCKRCRRALIYPENIIEHEPGKGQTAFQHRKRDSNFAKGHNETCSSYFIEPMAWIEGLQGGALEGKIDCPKCNTKLGSYTWRGKCDGFK
ncbi:tyrosine protein phosphatase yvh1, variant 2 [Entomophthora muscae]|uniref:Tyrosine protein phosphatase yvh1, variant 2 n=1 Tax=Entomophthora muscae TaxID=34485 RepID=A0ACC2T1A3_9FUNG|nr:tyrosine protein phosphatase yvh1, variant 2 [Entomophthora muscae]